MAYRITVAYRQPTDPAAFDEYYRSTHVPIASRIPGAIRLTAGHIDSIDGSTPEFYLLGEVLFESRDDALAGFASPEGQAAVADIGNFADRGIVMLLSDEEFSVP
jgi:uncharacterized protein (TIGR02118 family)